MTSPLFRLLRHSGDSEHYWREIEMSHDEARLREKMEKIREKMVDGAVRLTKETVEFEGWGRGGQKRATSSVPGLGAVQRSKVKKPCAGCGETPRYGREIDKVCADCEKLIKEAADARAKAAKKGGSLVKLPRYFPSYSASYERARFWSGSDGIAKHFKAAVEALAKASSSPHAADPVILFRGEECDYSGALFEMGEEAVAALRLLDEKIKEAISEALAAGYQAGQNLLANIASGEITIKELNESTIKEKDARRKQR